MSKEINQVQLSNESFNAFSSRHDFKSTYLSSTGFNNTFMNRRNKTNHGSLNRAAISRPRRRNFLLASFDHNNLRSQSNSNTQKDKVSAIGGDTVLDHE